MRTGSSLALIALLLHAGCSKDDPDGTADSGSVPDAGQDRDAASNADAGDDDAGDSYDAGDTGDAGPRPDGGMSDLWDVCPPGSTLRHFSLEPVSPLPTRDMIDLPNLIPATEIVGAGEGYENSVRFDVCDRSGELTLRGLLYKRNLFEPVTYYRLDETISQPTEEFVQLPEGWVSLQSLPPSRFLVEGLTEALQGNLQPLRIRFAIDYGLVVMGHDGFIALASGNVTPTSIMYTSIYVLVGSLAEGDVFAQLECGFDAQPLRTSFNMATATFEVRACTFLGGGETTGYRITFLAVQDSSPELSEAERVRFEFPTEEDVERVMTYQWNHHNACDSFHLALPHADYAASTPPSAGCGPTVPNAPPRSFDDEPGGPVLFRIRYHGGEWTDGEITGCRHYMFCD